MNKVNPRAFHFYSNKLMIFWQEHERITDASKMHQFKMEKSLQIYDINIINLDFYHVYKNYNSPLLSGCSVENAPFASAQQRSSFNFVSF